MAEGGFPRPVMEVISTLVDLFRHQGKTEMVEILENARPTFDPVNYDNWNGGTTTWVLRLEVPVRIYAEVEPRLERIEKEIGSKLTYLGRIYENDPVDGATITPLAPGTSAPGYRELPSEADVRRIWPAGHFRLFLSHVSKHKIAVSKLKRELAMQGVEAFVAHEDIEPSLEWRNEIEIALRSMHALAALLTPDFHASNWTDQEIGHALGKGVLVLPVRLGIDPYGFAGKYQGISGSLEEPGQLASSIVRTLLSNPQTHTEMRRALVSSFVEAESHEIVVSTYAHINKIVDLADQEKTAIREACTKNPHVAGDTQLIKHVYAQFGVLPDPTAGGINEQVPF